MSDGNQSIRRAFLRRTTGETDVEVDFLIKDRGNDEYASDSQIEENLESNIETGLPFADHMLTLFAFWGNFVLNLRCAGDIHVDAHHSLEDVGLALGQVILEASGDRQGIVRTGRAAMPLDEALCEVTVDLSGRPYLVYRGAELLPPVIVGEERDLWREFFKSLAMRAQMNLHIDFRYGQNGHHLLESAFKSFGIALSLALSPGRPGIPSTKGRLGL